MESSRRAALCIAACLVVSSFSAGAQKARGPFALLVSGAYTGLHSSSQGYLGVDIRGVGDPAVSGLHLRETRGVVVIIVDHDGPAWKAGVREHDVILTVNGANVEGEEQLRRTLREMKPGRTVQIVLSRDGTQQNLTATMADSDEIGKRAWEQHWVVPAPSDVVADDASTNTTGASRATRGFAHGFVSGHLLPGSIAYTGVMVNEIEPQLADFFGIKGGKGLLVQSVDSNSPAAVAGLHAGDVVTHVNGTALSTKSEWTKALRDSKGHPVSMTIMRDHHETVLTMVPDAKRRSAVDVQETPAQKPRWLAALLPW